MISPNLKDLKDFYYHNLRIYVLEHPGELVLLVKLPSGIEANFYLTLRQLREAISEKRKRKEIEFIVKEVPFEF